jgi:hypothetical protein
LRSQSGLDGCHAGGVRLRRIAPFCKDQLDRLRIRVVGRRAAYEDRAVAV